MDRLRGEYDEVNKLYPDAGETVKYLEEDQSKIKDKIKILEKELLIYRGWKFEDLKQKVKDLEEELGRKG